MERSAFLSSLPFLIPLHSPAWPPVADGTVLLGESFDNTAFVLSLELPSLEVGNGGVRTDGATDADAKENGPTLPLFFSVKRTKRTNGQNRARDDTDPALAKVQIAVANYHSDTEESNSAPSTVFLRVDEHVYVLDVSRCRSIEIQEEAYNTPDDDDDASFRQRRVCRPCSLVMEFDNLLLRIFRNTLDVCPQDKDTLAIVLSALSSTERSFAFQCDHDALVSSPSRSSNNTSSGSTTVDGVDNLNNHQSASGRKRPAECYNNVAVDRLHRHRSSFHDARANLAKTRQVLDMPVSAISSVPNEEDGLDKCGTDISLKPLLNATAQYLSQGYVPEASMTIIEDHYSELQHEKELEMEQLLGAFFPAPHRSGRRRQSGDGTDDAMHKPQHVCGGSTVAAFLDLVAQEQLIVKNRHRLFLMPTRG